MDKKEFLAKIRDQLGAIETLKSQSINLFDKPEVQDRMSMLLGNLDENIHGFNRCFEDPSPEENQLLQDLFFHTRKLIDITKDLKQDPHQVDLQQALADSIDHFKADISRLV